MTSKSFLITALWYAAISYSTAGFPYSYSGSLTHTSSKFFKAAYNITRLDINSVGAFSYSIRNSRHSDNREGTICLGVLSFAIQRATHRRLIVNNCYL